MAHSRKLLQAAAVSSVMLLAACAKQEPAPIIEGRITPYSGQRYASSSYNQTPNTLKGQPSPRFESQELANTSPFASSDVYVVQGGDTLNKIAAHFDVEADDVIALNKLSSNSLHIGQEIIIPSRANNGIGIASRADTLSATSLENTDATDNGYRLTTKYGDAPETVANSTVQTPAVIAAAPVVSTEQYASHVVQAGENAYRIGLKYDVSAAELMRINGIKQPSDLKIGQKLNVPNRGIDQFATPVAVAPSHPHYGKIPQRNGTLVAAKTTRQAPVALTNTLKSDAAAADKAPKSIKREPVVATGLVTTKGMIWPVQGPLVKSFGQKGGGVNHTGINIRVPENTPVVAAEDGIVIYSDSGLKSYGNLILIQHDKGLVTAYGHNSQNNVAKNQRVLKGEVIAYAGRSGGVSEPQLHFEVRRNERPIDPIALLPKE